MNFPQMIDEFSDWQDKSTWSIVTKTISDYEVTEGSVDIFFEGFFYPMKPQEIALKPEGQRTWKFYKLVTSKNLTLDDIIKKSDKKEYRVMGKEDWSIAGFYNYDLVEAFHV